MALGDIQEDLGASKTSPRVMPRIRSVRQSMASFRPRYRSNASLASVANPTEFVTQKDHSQAIDAVTEGLSRNTW